MSEVEKKKQSAADIEAEIKLLELEAKRLEVQEKQANLQDLQERLLERQLRRETLGERGRINGRTLSQTAAIKAQRQRVCTHRKGGNGLAEYISGQGQDPQYAVIKHIFLNGDMWIRCQRCGKTWKPPLEEDFDSKAAYNEARDEYLRAKAFPTKNSTSSSYMFQWTDGGLYSRKVLRPTTLE